MQALDVYHKHWNKDLLYLFNEKDIYDPAKRKYCEHSEEIIVNSVFSHFPPRNRWCVDVGACSIRSSNTYRLTEDGWFSIQIEADGDKVLEMQSQVGKNVTMVHAFVTPGKLGGKAEPHCLENILLQHDVPKDFDFLNIDIDCYEYEVWLRLQSFSPNLICIECNQFETDFSVIDYDPSFDITGTASLSQYRGKHDGYGGATVGLLNKLAEKKGYTYLCLDVSNAFYIKNSFIGI